MAKSNRQQRHRQVEFMVEISALHFSHESEFESIGGSGRSQDLFSQSGLADKVNLLVLCEHLHLPDIEAERETERETSANRVHGGNECSLLKGRLRSERQQTNIFWKSIDEQQRIVEKPWSQNLWKSSR